MRKLSLSMIAILTVFVAGSQNVGIGTTAPESILHVAQTNDATDGINGTYLNLQNTTIFGATGYLAGLRFRVDGVGTPVNSRYKGAIFFQKTGSFGVGSLHFATNNSGSNSSVTMADAHMTINSAGDVGVGTTSPNYKMHIAGGDFFFYTGGGSFKLGYDASNQWRFSTIGGGADLIMGSSLDGSVFTQRHYFDQAGNVGIGTGSVSPGARLHVQTTASEVVRVNGASPYISFFDNTDGYKGYVWYNGTDMVFGSGTTNVRFASSGYRMTINTDGRVSIGSANNLATGYLLNVDGKIISEELKVQLSGSWPDYVFADDYRLMSLEDLEKSIRQHRHLPNIPSAASVTAEKGFEVGDMNKRLLEKVEELTLYIIELNKKIKLLEEKVNK